MPRRGKIWEFSSRASTGENKKAIIPHATARLMRQTVSPNLLITKDKCVENRKNRYQDLIHNGSIKLKTQKVNLNSIQNDI